MSSDHTADQPTPAGSATDIDPDVERMWREHWWPIVAPNGTLDLNQIKRELFDYGNLLDNVPLVYCHVTGGVASKPFTLPSVINSLHDEYVAQRVDEALEEERADAIAAASEPAESEGSE